MIIRPANFEDFKACVRLAMVFLETVCIPKPELVINDLSNHFASDDAFVFVAFDETLEHVCGLFYGSAQTNVFTGEQFVAERFVYIEPNYRDSVVMSGFLQQLEKWSIEHGCKFARVQPRGSHNNEALATILERRHGFERVGLVLEKQYESVSI